MERTRDKFHARQRDVTVGLEADYNAGTQRGQLVIYKAGVKTVVAYFDDTGFNPQVAQKPLATADLGSTANPYRDLFLSGFVKGSVENTITAHAGGTQAAAYALTKQFSYITVCATQGDSVRLPASVVGMSVWVYNGGAAAAAVFGAATDTINGIATAVGVPLPSGVGAWFNCAVAGTWLAGDLKAPILQELYATAANTAGFTATGAQVGGANVVTLNLTGALGAGANIQLPTVAALVAAIPNAFVGQSYRLRIINLSSGAFSWTVTTNTGWTLNNTMTIGQNFSKDFVVTLTSLAAATIQSLGQVAQSAV